MCHWSVRIVLAEQTEWTGIIVWLSISGFFRGSALANFTLTVSEYCSLEKLPAAFGWHMIGKAVFVVALGPLIGECITHLAILLMYHFDVPTNKYYQYAPCRCHPRLDGQLSHMHSRAERVHRRLLSGLDRRVRVRQLQTAPSRERRPTKIDGGYLSV